MKLDVKTSKISFLAAAGFKWLLSPIGTGFIFIDRKLISDVDMAYLSYVSLRLESDQFNYEIDLKTDASRFKIGSFNEFGVAAMEKSLELLLEIGIDNIQEHILNLTGYAADQLRNKDYRVISHFSPENRSGILSFNGKNLMETYSKLLSKNIIISLRKDWIRISPHLFNNKDDIDRLLAEL